VITNMRLKKLLRFSIRTAEIFPYWFFSINFLLKRDILSKISNIVLRFLQILRRFSQKMRRFIEILKSKVVFYDIRYIIYGQTMASSLPFQNRTIYSQTDFSDKKTANKKLLDQIVFIFHRLSGYTGNLLVKV
jgi:hypothetical protein